MSREPQQLDAECRHLRSEVAALEQLVERYQDELEIRASDTPMDSSSGSFKVEEELFEHQRLYPSGWETRLLPDDRPSFSRVDGQASSFTEVYLPSLNWEWVSDWRYAVHKHTDADGWIYAPSWDLLDEAERASNTEKTTSDFVRRRRWTRDRMLVRSTGLPASSNRLLHDEARFAAMQQVNQKLTEQLMRANDRILEYENRAQIYEKNIRDLQALVSILSTAPSDARSPRTSMKDASTAPYTVESSVDALRETEELLDSIMSSNHTLVSAHKRRTEIVEECQSELQFAVDEFHDLVRSYDRRETR